MIIVSDIVSLKDRGKYQGFLGSAIAIGGGIGPLIGGVFSQTATWRWYDRFENESDFRVFWFSVPISVLILIQLFFFLPLTKVSGNMTSKLKKIDYAGSVISLAATIFVLVPISGGGVTYEWNSPLVIVLLTLGVLLYIVFVIYEARFAKIPIMPSNPGFDYSSNFSASVQDPISIPHPVADIRCRHRLLRCSVLFTHLLTSSSTSKCHRLWRPSSPTYHHTNLHRHPGWSHSRKVPRPSSTCLISRTGHYNPCIIGGFALWTVGLGLQTTFSPDISLGKIIGYLIIEGFGIGLTFQTSIFLPNSS